MCWGGASLIIMTAAMAMVVIRNDEIVEDNVEDGQPLEVGQVIQAECKPPLAVSSLLVLGVCNRYEKIMGIERGW